MSSTHHPLSLQGNNFFLDLDSPSTLGISATMQTFTVPKTEPHELDSIPRPISPPSSRAQPPPPPLSSSLLLSSRLARDSLADSPFRGKPQWPLEFILFFDPSSREADRLLNLLVRLPLLRFSAQPFFPPRSSLVHKLTSLPPDFYRT